MSAYGDWEPVIGLEVHAQLLTETKLFCGCATSFGDPPNTHTCPVCLGLPGALPVLNGEALRLAVTVGLALGCRIARRSLFARKNYFYPDLPKGYQISQYEEPLCLDGALEIEGDGGPKRVRIRRAHVEEDAGKNLHGASALALAGGAADGEESIVDLNRAGTPLVEIVSEPDLRSPAEARDYLKRLRELCVFVGANDGNLEQGSFRADANVSVRRRGDEALGTRVELKNLNSFRFVEDAIDGEVRRQIALRERGEPVRQQTRGWAADKKQSYLLRDKEGDAGYRYFPEPDLPPLSVDELFVAQVAASLPELPDQKRARFVEEYGLTPQAAAVMTGHPRLAAFFEEAVLSGGSHAELEGNAVATANFIQSEVLRDAVFEGLDARFAVTARQVADVLRLVADHRISGKQAKEVYAALRGTDRTAESIVAERGMEVVGDRAALEKLARALVREHAGQAEKYRKGKTALLGFFVGQLMKQTRGSADPALANEVVKACLAEPPGD
ncbi:MAG: Asp-tRNA(Asn)/Glu-tRNA(Gln) amidotransferase subunit GatB [Polyangiaceae bacterium]|nr:Asp-tRNA(Asn)/Glu-tRNA(Gln) amidotransferase subunit GatB [Polyangiaceae bacterium]